MINTTLSTKEQSTYDKCLKQIKTGPNTPDAIGEPLWLIKTDCLFRDQFGDMRTFLSECAKMDFEEGFKIIEEWEQTPRGIEVTRQHTVKDPCESAPIANKMHIKPAMLSGAPAKTKGTGADAGKTVPVVKGIKAIESNTTQARRRPRKQVLSFKPGHAMPATNGENMCDNLKEESTPKPGSDPAQSTPVDQIEPQPEAVESEQDKPSDKVVDGTGDNDAAHVAENNMEVLPEDSGTPTPPQGPLAITEPIKNEDVKTAGYWLEKINPVLVRTVDNVEAKSQVDTNAAWTPLFNLTLTKASQTFTWTNTGTSTPFFRAVESTSITQPFLLVDGVHDQAITLRLKGTAGGLYLLESTTNIAPPISWVPVQSLTLTNATQSLVITNHGEPVRVFRARVN